ncbi:MAG: hypothetical protein LC674_07190 [Actinobacteria bacterium]|nr:hypothetical protein [Actinomycetota bacterium]
MAGTSDTPQAIRIIQTLLLGGLFVERFQGGKQLIELLGGIRPVKLWKCLGLRRSFLTVSIVAVVCLYLLNYATGLIGKSIMERVYTDLQLKEA